jgi:hypothetical protein
LKYEVSGVAAGNIFNLLPKSPMISGAASTAISITCGYHEIRGYDLFSAEMATI